MPWLTKSAKAWQQPGRVSSPGRFAPRPRRAISGTSIGREVVSSANELKQLPGPAQTSPRKQSPARLPVWQNPSLRVFPGIPASIYRVRVADIVAGPARCLRRHSPIFSAHRLATMPAGHRHGAWRRCRLHPFSQPRELAGLGPRSSPLFVRFRRRWTPAEEGCSSSRRFKGLLAVLGKRRD